MEPFVSIKVSELIKRLEEIEKDYGDLYVFLNNGCETSLKKVRVTEARTYWKCRGIKTCVEIWEEY